MTPSDRLRRIIDVARDELDLPSNLLDDSGSMLDGAQTSTLYWLTRMEFQGIGQIAELGAYTGGTTRVFGHALARLNARRQVLEVYDLFEHNETSRRRLSAEPGYNEHDFYEIWRHKTSDYAKYVDLRRGDLRSTAVERTKPLEILYVDIVKHESLINPLMNHLLPRLTIGGLLIHQDYFHWQSPWVVYATEHLMSNFEIVGTVSNHMMVLHLTSAIPPDAMERDFIDGLDRAQKLELMQRSIDRYPGLRGGLLRVSRLNLAQDWSEFDFDSEVSAIRAEYSNASRVLRYLDAVVSSRTEGRDAPMW